MDRLKSRILYSLAAFGASQLIGIPFVGGVLAALLDGVAVGAETTADIIRYASMGEAHEDMEHAISRGARVLNMYPNDDGTVGIKYDLSEYSEEI